MLRLIGRFPSPPCHAARLLFLLSRRPRYPSHPHTHPTPRSVLFFFLPVPTAAYSPSKATHPEGRQRPHFHAPSVHCPLSLAYESPHTRRCSLSLIIATTLGGKQEKKGMYTPRFNSPTPAAPPAPANANRQRLTTTRHLKGSRGLPTPLIPPPPRRPCPRPPHPRPPPRRRRPRPSSAPPPPSPAGCTPAGSPVVVYAGVWVIVWWWWC